MLEVLRSNVVTSFAPSLTKNVARVFFATLVSLLVLFLQTQPVFACIITITPDSTTGYVGDVLTFTIDVEKTHRTCLTPIDETEIKLTGMEMVSQTLWQQVSSEAHKKQITVILSEVGEGLIEVSRECTLRREGIVLQKLLSRR